jgi:hypothetical protein
MEGANQFQMKLPNSNQEVGSRGWMVTTFSGDW